MEEIVIKDSDGLQSFDITIKHGDCLLINQGVDTVCVDKINARQLADAIYKLLGIDIERKAFEAGREQYNDGEFDQFTHDSFDDYKNRGK